MNLIFFDHPVNRDHLKPFTLTRPLSDIRCGILRLGEKWQQRLTPLVRQASHLTEPYLSVRFPLQVEADNLLVNPAFCPDEALVRAVGNLQKGQVLLQKGQAIAIRLGAEELLAFKDASYNDNDMLDLWELDIGRTPVAYTGDVSSVSNLWDIFLLNGNQIKRDFSLLTQGRLSQTIADPHTVFYGDQMDIFIEEGAQIKASILNAESGPIYIGKNAVVHENAVLLGPMALLEGSHINISSKIREATTIGPFSKMGGEVKNVVVFGNSNKGHEGFLGNSVVGEWCNFGADTNNSNLKNNYQPVKLWSYHHQNFENSGQLFCGLMMGDHSKCGINTMFNTGTVVGVSANIFGAGYQSKFIPSFSWGGADSHTTYRVDKALEVASHVMQRRGVQMDEAEKHILRHIFENRATEMKRT